MKFVIASDKFKGTLSAVQACHAIAAGLRSVMPDAELVLAPMADGGEGTVEAVVSASEGEYREATVRGPLGAPVRARYGLIDSGRTAVIEMAAASGLGLVEPSPESVLRASTFGTGELMCAALAAGATRLLLAIGGSATNDGGCGMAQALGVRFLRADGTELPAGIGGGDLADIASIDAKGVQLRGTGVPARGAIAEDIAVLCDVHNPLTGPNGAARIYARQKGATDAEIDLLDRNLEHLATVVRRDLGCDVENLPGVGAAGGLGAGLVAFAGARLLPGAATIIERINLRDRCRPADAIITGEGRVDVQSLHGKVISAVADLGRELGIPTYVLAGQVALADSVWRKHFQDAAGVVEASAPPPRDAAARLAELAATKARDWFSAHRLRSGL